MIDTDKYEGHTPGPWKIEHFPELDAVRESYYDEDLKLIAAAPELLAEVRRFRKNKSNLFTTIEQKLNEKGDEGEAIWEANPDGHYKEDELRGWCEALEFVLSLMKAQEREE